MLDLSFVRGNLALVEEKLRARGADPVALLGDFRSLDLRRREAITQAETLKARRNELSQQVGQLKKAGQDATALMDETRALKDKLESRIRSQLSFGRTMRFSPARAFPMSLATRCLRESPKRTTSWSRRGARSAASILSQSRIGNWVEALGILDLERAAKLSGARFAVYMGAGARLERALIRFMLEPAYRKTVYTENLPPSR